MKALYLRVMVFVTIILTLEREVFDTKERVLSRDAMTHRTGAFHSSGSMERFNKGHDSHD